MEHGKLVYFSQQWVYRFETFRGAKAHANIMNASAHQFEYRVERIGEYYYIGIYDNGEFWTWH